MNKINFLILVLAGVLLSLVSIYHPYKREITITEMSGRNLTDYQIELEIDTKSLISEGKMNSDCSDIRFTDDSGNSLGYWIESGCNTNKTTIWVKVPLIPANSSTVIYMHYGNRFLRSESDMNTVFIPTAKP